MGDHGQFPIHRHDSTDTQRESNLLAGLIKTQLPETRRIAIGKKGDVWKESARGTKWRPPVKLDHFLVQLMTQDEKGDYIVDAKAHEAFGAKPRSLPITFLYDRPGLNVHMYLGLYAGRTAWCKGDGKTASRLDKDTEERKPFPCPCELLTQGKCKTHLVLQARLPTQPVGEVAKFRTTSRHSISFILAGMGRIMEVTSEFFNLPRHQGILAKIPLQLNLNQKTATTKDGTSHTIPVVSISYNGTEEELETFAHKRMKRYEGVVSYLRKLKELEVLEVTKMKEKIGQAESPEEVRRITEEFAPDAIDDVKKIEDIPAPKDRANRSPDAEEFEAKKKAAEDLLDSQDIPEGLKQGLEPTDEDIINQDPDVRPIPPAERRDRRPPPKKGKRPSSSDDSWV